MSEDVPHAFPVLHEQHADVRPCRIDGPVPVPHELDGQRSVRRRGHVGEHHRIHVRIERSAGTLPGALGVLPDRRDAKGHRVARHAHALRRLVHGLLVARQGREVERPLLQGVEHEVQLPILRHGGALFGGTFAGEDAEDGVTVPQEVDQTCGRVRLVGGSRVRVRCFTAAGGTEKDQRSDRCTGPRRVLASSDHSGVPGQGEVAPGMRGERAWSGKDRRCSLSISSWRTPGATSPVTRLWTTSLAARSPPHPRTWRSTGSRTEHGVSSGSAPWVLLVKSAVRALSCDASASEEHPPVPPTRRPSHVAPEAA